jgi:DnaJ-domain-containing protein 1
MGERHCINTHCLIAVAIAKYARRITAEFVMSAKYALIPRRQRPKERKQEQEAHSRSGKNSEREHAAGENGFDPYQALRITSGASKEEIKAAYFNLIKQYHPDKVSHLGQELRN